MRYRSREQGVWDSAFVHTYIATASFLREDSDSNEADVREAARIRAKHDADEVAAAWRQCTT